MKTKDKNRQAINQGRVPTLRFPAFQDAGEWKKKPLGSVLSSIANGLSINQTGCKVGYKVTRIETISDKSINLNKVGYIQTDQDISSYKLCVGDILFSNINSLSHIGKVVIVDQDYDLYHGMNLLRLVVHKNTNDPYFLFYQLSTQKLKASFEARANKAVNQASINQTELKKTVLVAPTLPEQQKIADCLSSLDDLIAAQAHKLDTLKSHKKGLMQQLFPIPGQTIPTLRFPEFQDAGEWRRGLLGDICSITSGGTPNRTISEYWNGEIPWVTTSLIDFNIIRSANEFISEVGLQKSSAKIFPKNTILMAMYGQGKTRGKIALLGIEATTNQACAALLVNKKLITTFVFQNLVGRYDEIRNLSNEGGQKNLSATLIKQIPISYPDSKKEQQKIADCLSSLDDLIAAQAHKLDTLKTHKKGLMQQLFPTPDEVDR